MSIAVTCVIAAKALARNAMRTALTALGLIIGVAASGFFEIVGELEASRDSEFDVVEGASGCGGAFTYEVEERVSGLREERRADPPVGDFTGEPQVGGAERCDVDGHVDRASRGA